MRTGCVAGVEAVMTALDQLDAAWEALVSLPVEGLGAASVLAVLDRIETLRRRLPAVEHGLLTHVQAVATDPGGVRGEVVAGGVVEPVGDQRR